MSKKGKANFRKRMSAPKGALIITKKGEPTPPRTKVARPK